MKIIRKLIAYISIVICCPYSGLAEDSFSSFVFLDTYSAYSENKLKNTERSYFTQPARNRDFHLNLASIGGSYDDGFIRAKLVGQYGDSVTVNYSAEPESDFRYIQESYVGTYFNKDLSIDVGTFLAHIGAESWLSKDNLNYTRSLIAEYSPYYESGVRLSYTVNEKLTAQVLGLNGWQNTTDDRHPALGTQLSYSNDGTVITSNTFIGKENYGTRLFHDFIASKKFDSGLSLVGSIDVGHQSSSSPASGVWWGYSLMAKKQVNDVVGFNGRLESFQDPNGIVVSSVTGQDFRTYGASLGLDLSFGHGIAVRSEVKHLWSYDKIYLNNESPTKDDTIFVVSLSFFNEFL